MPEKFCSAVWHRGTEQLRQNKRGGVADRFVSIREESLTQCGAGPTGVLVAFLGLSSLPDEPVGGACPFEKGKVERAASLFLDDSSFLETW